MFQKKDFGNIGALKLLECDLVAPTVDINSAAADLLNYDGCLFIVNCGESNDSLSGSVYLEFEVETSDDNSTWVDAADAVVTNTVTGTNTGTFAKVDAAAEDDAIFTAAYLGRERYVRVVVNVTGSHTNGTPLSIVCVRTRAQYP